METESSQSSYQVVFIVIYVETEEQSENMLID